MMHSRTLGGSAFILCLSLAAPTLAVAPGDANNDTVIDISDVIAIFEWLSLNQTTRLCINAADVNQDGRVEYIDAIFILGHMYGNVDGNSKVLSSDELDSCESAASRFLVVDEVVSVITPVSAMVSWLT